MSNVNITPTADLYGQLQWLADHFNRALFDGGLPSTVITVQRSAHTAGHFSESRWRHVSGASISELALNPTYFASRPLIFLCQTIAHELCHLWQHIDGSASRHGYHNSAWATKMEIIGLMPSATGRPGGVRTGQKMSDYPITGGRFLLACEDLIASDFGLRWIDQGQRAPTANRSYLGGDVKIDGQISERLLVPLGNLFPAIDEIADKAGTRNSKIKYQCPRCRLKVWGKHGLAIMCRNCEEDLEEILDEVRN
jgi:hypothetical protein